MRFDFNPKSKTFGKITKGEKKKKAPSKGKKTPKKPTWAGNFADWAKGGKRGKDLMKP